MSTITKERLEQLANFRGAPVTRQEDQELARIALASLEAEPVAVCQHQWKFGGANKLQSQKQCIKCGRVELVAAAPPAPISVPDEMDDIGGVCCEVSYADGWNACRAAMLQGSEPVSNRDELPDGWVACSERMPKNGDSDIWLFDGEFVHHGYIWDGHDFVDWNEEYESITGITHWMKMVLPAAPQQEVS